MLGESSAMPSPFTAAAKDHQITPLPQLMAELVKILANAVRVALVGRVGYQGFSSGTGTAPCPAS